MSSFLFRSEKMMEWKEFFADEGKKEYFKELKNFIDDEYSKYTCYPPYDELFNAYKLTRLDDIKVVIIGQDPYHNPGEAHGLAFSVKCPKLPPSLVNIYKEMASDLNHPINQDGDLTYLASQGVFLLNTTLSVRENMPLSHSKKGWEIFTDNTIKLINSLNQPIVFILWGNKAIEKKKMLNNPNHLVLTSPHPSPLGAYRGFFGSKPFSKANDFLEKNGQLPIRWYKND